MGKNTFKIIIPVLALFLAGFEWRPGNISSEEKFSPREAGVREVLLSQIDSFYNFLSDSLEPLSAGMSMHAISLQQAFLKARLYYKDFEWAAEYFTGATAQLVNGPPVPEIDNVDLLNPVMARAIDPAGLQVIEELIFPWPHTSKKEELKFQIDFIKQNTLVIRKYIADFPLADWRILDGSKLQVFRILTLGITGFDSPLTLKSMAEAARSFQGMKRILSLYIRTPSESSLINLIDEATAYLLAHQDFDSFDRAAFITNYGNPISRGIAGIEKESGYPVKYNRMLRQEATTLFDNNVFNPDAFAPGAENYMSSEKTILGEKLFFDINLSGTHTRSCGSCHQPDKSFADGLAKNTDLHDSKKNLPRNTPTLLNAALQSNQFYDMRALTLEDQVDSVLHNPEELDGNMNAILRYIKNNKEYRRLFATAFPQKDMDQIDGTDVLNALGSYVRSLTWLNSRFDEYMQGNPSAMTQTELNGFNLFMGKARCATCHFMPVFNGITPPKYIVNDAEIIGVPLSLTDSVIDPDPGFYNIIGIDFFKHAFKTPTLRNIAETAPYMHNGIYNTLEEVMEFYNNGGGTGLGIHLPNQTLSEDKLNLTSKEVDEIIAFMKSLSSK